MGRYWFATACAAAIVHKTTFFCLYYFQVLRVTFTRKEIPVQSINVSSMWSFNSNTFFRVYYHRSCIKYLPSSIPQIQQSNFVSLLEGDVSVSQNVSSMITPKPSSQHPMQRALLDLEKGLGNEKHTFLKI